MSNHIHKEVLQSYCDSEDDSLVYDLFSYFKGRVPDRFEAAKAAINAQDNKAFKFQLHALKNSFLNVGALEVAQECQSLEDRSATLNQEALFGELTQLHEKFIAVEAELGQMLRDKVSFKPDPIP